MFIMTKDGWKSLGGVAERLLAKGAEKRAALESARVESREAREAFIEATRQRQPIENLRALSREATAASLRYLAI